jgi:hypothetical protein
MVGSDLKVSLTLLVSGDDMFSDVVRDFSNMASNNPEKLKRGK